MTPPAAEMAWAAEYDIDSSFTTVLANCRQRYLTAGHSRISSTYTPMNLSEVVTHGSNRPQPDQGVRHRLREPQPHPGRPGTVRDAVSDQSIIESTAQALRRSSVRAAGAADGTDSGSPGGIP